MRKNQRTNSVICRICSVLHLCRFNLTLQIVSSKRAFESVLLDTPKFRSVCNIQIGKIKCLLIYLHQVHIKLSAQHSNAIETEFRWTIRDWRASCDTWTILPFAVERMQRRQRLWHLQASTSTTTSSEMQRKRVKKPGQTANANSPRCFWFPWMKQRNVCSELTDDSRNWTLIFSPN